MSRILIVDDDTALLRALAINLRARRYEVVAATDGNGALRHAATTLPDLIILDLGLPDMDGTDVIGGLRGWTRAPILVLSARDMQAAKVQALDCGADDYLTKPFGMDELLARVRAALRRTQPGDAEPIVTTEHFHIDVAAKRARTRRGDVRLTPTEWHVLEVLLRNQGKLVSHRQLLQEVWGPSYEKESNYLRVHIAALRRKLEPDPSRPRHLLTEPGLGYRYQP